MEVSMFIFLNNSKVLPNFESSSSFDSSGKFFLLEFIVCLLYFG